MNLPRRRKSPKLGVKEAPQIRCASHLAWVRGHECAIEWPLHMGKIEAAHVRTGTDGGTGVKPSDCWVIPLCSHHHAEQHQIGERSFEARYKIDMKAIAKALWDKSPHKRKHQQ